MFVKNHRAAREHRDDGTLTVFRVQWAELEIIHALHSLQNYTTDAIAGQCKIGP